MNKYAAYWKGQIIEVEAETTYEAQIIATPVLQKTTRKNVKQYDVNVFLTEKNGEVVFQTITS